MENLQKTPWEGWETVREIGSGSFGTVYEIQRKLINGQSETAAMKVMQLPKKKSEIDRLYRSGYTKENIAANYRESCKNITEEYSLMRKLDGSANVVNCKDIHYMPHEDDIGWDIFIRMELLKPLEDVLASDIPEETVLRLGIDMCKALELCKKHNIVHRDIKPQNIFISPNGDYKLGDFGIAREMEATEKGTAIGTFNYMAPEVFFGQAYGSRADIYSLGIVLYWMLNDRVVPFAEKSKTGIGMQNTEAARKRRMAGEALPAPAHGSQVLQKIVLKACAFNPQDRYESATQMLEDLRKAELALLDVPTAYKNFDVYAEKPKKSRNRKQTERNVNDRSAPKKAVSGKIIGLCVAVAVLILGCSLLGVKFLNKSDEIPSVGQESTPVATDATTATEATATEPVSATEPVTIEPDITVAGIAAFADVDDEYDGEALNMRRGPAREYDLITTVPDESSVTILGYSDNGESWVYIEYNGYKGWVLSKYVTPQGTQSSDSKKTGVVSDDTPSDAGLNVRSEPAYASTHLTTLSEGETLTYYPDTATNGYVYCEFSGNHDGVKSGWILSKYITEQTQTDTTEASDTLATATYFISAQASSVLPPYGEYTYEASNVLINDNSCWCENSASDGTGEWLLLRLPGKQILRGLQFINGYVGTEWQYENNAKAKKLRLEFADGWSCETTLSVFDTEKRNTVQCIVFENPVETDYVKIIIESVEDAEYEDTCLTYIAPY
ncbi:MAG: hypothetical protein E7523_10520 [Ruminococcaceae bacterium]|nr:hypothetical protein [Oscillospiraceae bacterium]